MKRIGTIKPIIAATLALACTTAMAEVRTIKSDQDSHIQHVVFTWDVIKVVLAEGVSTTIELPRDEVIKTFAMGDREAWKAKHDGNLFLLKPAQVKGNTNLVIYGSKRNYLFRLQMLKAETPEVAWWVTVKSPEEVKTSPAAVLAAQRKAEEKQIRSDLKAAVYQGRVNKDYWIVGPRELQPLAAHDNGTLTYLTFSAAHALPAAFVLEADGSESLVDFHMEGQTMVLHRVVDRIILRRGTQVAGITNRSVDRPALASPTGTISDRVERVIIQQEGENQ